MTEEDIRRLREALYVLQELLVRNLMFDALKIETEERLNFFSVYRGALMDGIVVDWWKIFGNRNEPSHWSRLLPESLHETVRQEMRDALSRLDPPEEYGAVWNSVERFRNTNAAHLDFDEAKRARSFPRLTPLRVSAEVMYERIYRILEDLERESGYPPPEGMMGEIRDHDLEHTRKLATTARTALAGFSNSE